MTRIRRALPPALLAAAALAFAFAADRSLACPIQIPPQPLRSLYKQSERVVVARVVAREVLGTEEDAASVRVALHVTENVKGPPAQLIHLHQTGYAVEEAENDGGDEVVVDFASRRPIPRLKRGERYLFFLDPREEGDGYEVYDEGYGIKQLSDDDLKVYLERLKELAEITRRGPEEKHALVEWLVRCAEQPATRWEGAYELLASAEAVAAGDTEPEAPAEAKAPDTPGGAEVRAAPDTPAEGVTAQNPTRFAHLRFTRPDAALVPLLNAVQKQRLADALFAAPEPKDGDDELMQVVKDFKDPRFPAFILARLHRFEDEAPATAELWLHTLAASLDSSELGDLADYYTQNASYFEEVETPADETPADAPGEAQVASDDEGVAAEEVDETAVDPEVEAARASAAAERATGKRSAMLKALLSRIDLFLSTGQLAPN